MRLSTQQLFHPYFNPLVCNHCVLSVCPTLHQIMQWIRFWKLRTMQFMFQWRQVVLTEYQGLGICILAPLYKNIYTSNSYLLWPIWQTFRCDLHVNASMICFNIRLPVWKLVNAIFVHCIALEKTMQLPPRPSMHSYTVFVILVACSYSFWPIQTVCKWILSVAI